MQEKSVEKHENISFLVQSTSRKRFLGMQQIISRTSRAEVLQGQGGLVSLKVVY